MTPLPVEPAHRLADRALDQGWLVTGLWSEEAVGIIGGEPKCCKSFLALDLAVAVAAGALCLRRFAVPKPGRVLLYAAEDALHIVRRRLDGICGAAGLSIADLDVQVITAPTLRLDLEADRARLDQTIARLKPRLLVLDPFVRLHRIDENLSGEVAPLLAFLRELQRRHGLAVSVVHMPGKAPATSEPAKPCAARPSSTPGVTPTSPCAVTAISSPLPSSTAPHPPCPPLPSNSPSAPMPSPSKSSTADHNQNRPPSNARSTSASPPPSPKPLTRSHSPICAPCAACALPPSTSVWPP